MEPINDSFRALVRQRDGLAVIDLYGDIDGFSDAALEIAYTEAEEQDTPAIMLNFSRVGYINSTGIALIVGLLARARKAHRRLITGGLSDHYKEIFNITRLSDFMTIFPDEETALQDLATTA
ncbi:MAG: STAS domain-containing protein [Chloroflexota bacterium]|jgi:anti-sigma B factor antagonist